MDVMEEGEIKPVRRQPRPKASENRVVKKSGPWSQPQFQGFMEGRR